METMNQKKKEEEELKLLGEISNNWPNDLFGTSPNRTLVKDIIMDYNYFIAF